MKQFMKKLSRPVLVARSRRPIRALSELPGSSPRRLARALDHTFNNSHSEDELRWITRIEELRTRLNTAPQPLELIDYGAGSTDGHASAEEMYRGRAVKTTVAELSRSSSKPFLWAHLLFRLIREFQPERCLELGTCLGVSAAYQSAALKLNGKGELVTLEGADVLARMSAEHLRSLDLDNVHVVVGRFQDTLERVLEERGPFSYAFIDGHHDEQATLEYFDRIMPRLTEPSVIVFDDISWSDGMRRAWSKITSTEQVRIAVGLRAVGVVVLDGKITEKHVLSIPMV